MCVDRVVLAGSMLFVNYSASFIVCFFFFQAEDGIRDGHVTGVQTCALPIFPGASPEAMVAGFPGGVPVVQTPAGEFMWDSTAMIHHLELRFPEPAVLPPDPVQRFLCYVVEDAADEWLYRPAVGTRWYFPENAALGGFELARDVAVKMPVACDQAHAAVGAHVRSSCPP